MISDNEEYANKNINENQIIKNDFLFSSKKFNYFNKDKCDYIYTHITNKMCMYFGVKGVSLVAPFSAPFSFPRYASEHLKYLHIYNFFLDLKKKVDYSSNIEEIKITLPPFIYNESLISKISHCLDSLGFDLLYRDLNSHINLNFFIYDDLPSSTKKAVRLSGKQKNILIHAKSDDDKKRAYEIIKQNREMKGYPLRMSWEQVKDTTDKVAKSDFFILNSNGEDSAAAIVFHINNNVVQVVIFILFNHFYFILF
jgi:hypothetical protein